MPYTPFDLSDKVALVTGGNRGIGLGMAEALAQAGADVAIWGSNPARTAAAVEQLEGHGVRVEGLVVDVTDEAAVDAGFERTVAALRRVDAVFVNAGVSQSREAFVDLDTDTYRRVLAVNLDGAFFTLRAAARHMAARAAAGDTAGGSLIGMASLAAIEGAARNEHYAATKGGLISMIRGCAVELARHGVRANAILPGWIATDMTQASQDNPKFVDNVIRRVPMRRWGEPADFGGLAVYLASDASRFQTGTTMVVDGGYSIF